MNRTNIYLVFVYMVFIFIGFKESSFLRSSRSRTVVTGCRSGFRARLVDNVDGNSFMFIVTIVALWFYTHSQFFIWVIIVASTFMLFMYLKIQLTHKQALSTKLTSKQRKKRQYTFTLKKCWRKCIFRQYRTQDVEFVRTWCSKILQLMQTPPLSMYSARLTWPNHVHRY